jgi:hypothetical protein
MVYSKRTGAMAGTITPHKTELGWVLDIPPEMASLLQVAPCSIAILFPKEGRMDVEILLPPSTELQEDFERLYAKYREKVEELKRLGD